MTTDCAMWCTACGVRLSEQETAHATCCPKCRDVGIPCDPAKDVFVEINWHELHVLCCWAEFWAASQDRDNSRSMQPAVAAIARRLMNQWPELGPLTLSGELAELPERLEASGIGCTSIATNLPKPAPFLSIGPGAVGHAKHRPAA